MFLCKFLIICVKLFAFLDLLLQDLDLRLLVTLRKCLLDLYLANVSESISHLGDDLGIRDLVVLSVHPSHFALSGQVASVHHPLLGTEGRHKFVVVGNDNDTTLELLNSLSEGTQRLSVEVVGRLVKNENMGLVPHGSGDHDLNLLSTREGRHTVVGRELGTKTTVTKVLLDIGGRESADIETSSLGKSGINGLAALGPSTSGKSLNSNPALFTTLELHFVLSLLVLVLTSVSNKFRNNLHGLALSSIIILP
mmetsp:Transcript_17955/g.26472  ORF Transcript_17955/g.26472 Transcript_17955/m.26472 type:complete len:252 (+) Transcript_17955:270-1025(+)